MDYGGLINDGVVGRLRERLPFFEQDRKKYTYSFGTNRTTLNIQTAGLGDEMMAQQLGRSFAASVSEMGDPELGSITLVHGGHAQNLDHHPSETNVYWWYSFGPLDDDPTRFYDEAIRPDLDLDIDLMLCGSKRIQREADQLGYETLSFPIGFFGFEPLGLDRDGLGYAGSVGHKSDEKVETVLGPFMNRPDFEWVSHFSTPDELGLWYNTRRVTFGLTKEGQRKWGVVNSRVFESLATATPLVLPDHPTLDDVLGFEYPYQAGDREEVRAMVDRLTDDPAATRTEFEEYARRVRADHDYTVRLDTLFSALS